MGTEHSSPSPIPCRPAVKGNVNGCIPNKLIDLVNERVDGVKTDLEETNKDLAALSTRVTTEVKRLDGNITTLTSGLKKLAGHVDDVESDLGKKITLVNGRVDGVVTDMAKLDTRLKTTEGDLVKLKARVTVTEADVVEINALIVKINKEIAALTREVNEIALEVSDNSADIGRIIACGRKSMFFNGTGCVATPEAEATESCKTDIVYRTSSSGNNMGGSFSSGDSKCPAGYKVIGTSSTYHQTARTSDRTEGYTKTTTTCLGMICK